MIPIENLEPCDDFEDAIQRLLANETAVSILVAQERMEIHGKAIQYGVETVNEARQYENLPPVEGGDVNFAQSALRPISALAKATVDQKTKESDSV